MKNRTALRLTYSMVLVAKALRAVMDSNRWHADGGIDEEKLPLSHALFCSYELLMAPPLKGRLFLRGILSQGVGHLPWPEVCS